MRIAITNHDPATVLALKSIILSVPDYELAWIANDGLQAVNMAKIDLPDLILIDLYMPNMDGIELTKVIMQQTPCAILIVTSSINDSSGKVFDAMGYGAVDAVNTPSLVENAESNSAADLLRKIAMINVLIDPSLHDKYKTKRNQKLTAKSRSNEKILVIGASTGGPKALATILAEFPSNFPAPIVIVQHVDLEFVQGLKQWLCKQIDLPVKLANQCELLIAGTVYLAGTGNHLVINQSGLLDYQEVPAHCIHKPSVNVLFESVASNWKGQAIGILLTGMGKDGAAGLLSMRDHGFCTLAQDEKSCAVYGMPKTAVELDAAQVVLPLSEIASAICKHYEVTIKSQDL